MSINRKKTKTIIGISVIGVGTAFIGLSLLAKKKKPESVYKNKPEQKNPLEGKRVVFVEDENDLDNADGKRGHLEAVGESTYTPGFYEKYIKRPIDVMLSFGGLVTLSPLLAGIAIAIKIDDPGPVLFTQKRLGQNKQYFALHKFRSMKMSTPHDVPTHMLDNPNQYITRVGKFLRAHSLDELPQIWDVFVGNMSVIGPRPGLWNQDLLTAERDNYGVNDVKPGLTGWAQINGRDELEIPNKAKLDGEYIEKIGLGMDIKCFLRSVHVFGKDKSVVEGGTGEINKIGRHYTDGKSEEELIGHIGFGEPVIVDTTANKSVLIVGAESYIGESFKAYADEHYSNNLTITSVDTLDGSWRETDFSVYDIVYHVAGIAHADVGNVDNATKEKYYAVNTDLAIAVAEKAKNEGVKEFIFMSSMIVYGESVPCGHKKVVDMHTVPSPSNFYGDSKLQADIGVRELASDEFKVVVLRPPMIYGKGSKGNYSKLTKLSKRMPVFPDIDNERSMLYIDNLCEFLCQLILIKTFRENAIILIPQNAEWTKTSDMVKEIRGGKMRALAILKPVVFVGGKIPGKIGVLINKAFGNNCYDQEVSEYEGLNYQKVSLNESIYFTGLKSGFRQTTYNNMKYVRGGQILQSAAKINVFIIGLRGYTQNYGGWESFIHGLLENWSDESVHFYAFEKVNSYDQEEVIESNGVTCIRVCENETGSSAMVKYDMHCTDITYGIVEKYKIKNPIMYHLGVRIGPYLWIKRQKIKKMGIAMIENPAGAEWRRTKWNRLVQVYLWISAVMMAKSTDCMACDNEGIKELYQKMLFGKKPILEYVAYGVDSIASVKEPMPDKVKDYFEKWGIDKDDYYLILGRFIPENNYEMMFMGFRGAATTKKLLVISNYQTEIQKFHEHIKKSTRYAEDKRIIMAGTLYDHEILHYVRQYAHGYIHGHSVGGTNPGLLEAMAETDINMLFDVNFNKYVGGDAAYYFSSATELSELINKIDSIVTKEKESCGILSKRRMEEKYTWQCIADKYSQIFHRLVNA